MVSQELRKAPAARAGGARGRRSGDARLRNVHLQQSDNVYDRIAPGVPKIENAKLPYLAGLTGKRIDENGGHQSGDVED